MPALTLQTEAFVLSRRPPSDVFETCTLFAQEQGLLTALQRLPKKTASKTVRLDLFDEAAVVLESSNQGRTWFVRDARLIARAAAIGRSYEALQAASAIASMIVRNPVPAEGRAAATALLRSALAALAGQANPELVLFKSLYRFGRDEGYPLSQQWLPSLTAELRRAAERLLRTPLADIGSSSEMAHLPALRRRLEEYLREHTDILV